jgi:Flp pilus assembly protein TadG
MSKTIDTTHKIKGQALVEFALLATLLITMLLGIFDFGRAYYTQVQIKNAVGDAGYFAVQNPKNRSGTKAVLKRQLGNLQPALTDSNITITCTGGETEIKVSYQYNLMFSWIVPSAHVMLGDETNVPQVDGCPSTTF